MPSDPPAPDRPGRRRHSRSPVRMTLRELAPSETGREPETRHPEARYLASHVERRTRLVITLRDGEQLRGRLAWYDRGALRVDREDGRHLVLMKHAIRHLAEDAPPAR